MHTPDNLAFPSKTHAYGRKTRYEIRRSAENGKHSVLVPSDQPTKGGKQWAHDSLEAAQNACHFINSQTGGEVANYRFLVMDFRAFESRYRVYLLNAGDHFHGFGGSRHGLVARKSASLVVSITNHMRSDTEYSINDKDAWERVKAAHAESLKV